MQTNFSNSAVILKVTCTVAVVFKILYACCIQGFMIDLCLNYMDQKSSEKDYSHVSWKPLTNNYIYFNRHVLNYACMGTSII